jgi:hypothetical protein
LTTGGAPGTASRSCQAVTVSFILVQEEEPVQQGTDAVRADGHLLAIQQLGVAFLSRFREPVHPAGRGSEPLVDELVEDFLHGFRRRTERLGDSVEGREPLHAEQTEADLGGRP